MHLQQIHRRLKCQSQIHELQANATILLAIQYTTSLI